MPPINLEFEKDRIKFNTARNQWRASQSVAKMAGRKMIELLKTDVCLSRTKDSFKTFYRIIDVSPTRENCVQVEVVNAKRHGVYTYHIDYFLLVDYDFEFIPKHVFTEALELQIPKTPALLDFKANTP